MEFDRTKNAMRTVSTGFALNIYTMILQFIMRTVIIYSLGNLYLGLNSLFSSILSTLNLAELGVGSALVFAMYKPVAEDNRELVRAYLKAYKKVYFAIGTFVLTAGIAIIPFLPKMIHGEYPHEINILVVYIIQLISTSYGYFFLAYKGSVLQVYQRVDMINIVSLVTDTVMYIIQILALLVFRNYYIYCGALLLKTISQNFIVAYLVKKRYPDLTPEGDIPSEKKKMVIKKTGALLGHKIGGVVVNSVDNILISAFIGLEIVAIYNNYYLVLSTLSGLFLMLTNGLSSIVGNYIIKKQKSECNQLFNLLHYIIAFLICICCTCMVNMYQPFIRTWTGDHSLLSFSSVVLFTACFFSIKIRTVGLLFKDASGLWEKDVMKPYIQVVIDLIIDLILLRTIGINGAIISTIACMLFGFFYEARVVFKYCLSTESKRYYRNTLLYLLSIFVSCFVSKIICDSIPISKDIVNLAASFAISIIISVLLFGASTFWTAEFVEARKFLKKKVFSWSI